MTTPQTEVQTTVESASAAPEPGTPQAAKRAPRKPRVPPAKAKSAKKTTSKKSPRKAKPARPAEGSRKGSKTSKVLDLLKRPQGATLKDLMKATGWKPHSVRGFLSGSVGKKMGLSVASVKDENGERRYSVKP